jgi:AcrR family transcriptional regulator
MRRIASELRVGTMSLYHHVADKDELLELMADTVSAELLVPGEILGDWREALRQIAHRTHDAFLRHPWLIDTAGARPLVTPNALRHVEQSVAIVVGLDVDRETAIAMVMATDDYTIGHVFRQSRFGSSARPVATEQDRDRVRDLLATGEFPTSRGSSPTTASSCRRPPRSRPGSSGCSTGCRRCSTPAAGRLAAR